jgi:hypothetical protein
VTLFARLQTELRSRWPEWMTILFFAAVVAFAIPWHEPWADEAQAWQLARTLSLPELFQTYIRYESSPGLWHLLLWILIRLHVSYTGLHWICGAISVAATTLLVLNAPFPRYLKLLLPFSYFLLFQYAVIARSYVLAPILLYLVALSWRRSPLLLALLLGLLANVALHAAVISGGLALVYCIEQVRNGGFKDAHRRRLLLSASILFSGYVLALLTAWPPSDLVTHISSVRGHSRPFFGLAIKSLLWLLYPYWLLAVAFWLGIVLCFRTRNSLLYLLPILLLAAFSGAVHFDWWHVGLLVPLLICLFWITWPGPGNKVSWGEVTGRTAMMVMVSLQIAWSVYAIHFDHCNAYSPDRAAAEYLRPFVQEGETITLTYSNEPDCHACRSVGILPYFDQNIYINEPVPFWWWSTRNPTLEVSSEVLDSHPDLVVVEAGSAEPEDPVDLPAAQVELLNRAGYSLTHTFCGARPMGFRVLDKSCHLIFQRVDRSANPSTN